MPSFLDLPLSVRHRIYAYTPLIRPCPIEVTRPYVSSQPPTPSPYGWLYGSSEQTDCLYISRKAGVDMGMPKDWSDCICPRLPLYLLLISRAIYQEVFFVFYSRNKFVIRLHATDAHAPNLESLYLNQHILNTMTYLLIRLNSWPCPRGHEELYPEGPSKCMACKTSTTEADQSLEITSPAGGALLSSWEKFAALLASSISYRQLRFTLICDVTDKRSGLAILKPVLLFPTLKQCVIRLGRHFDYELHALAREVSLRAQGSYCESQGSFAFQRLPKELRLQILNHTHLGYHNSYAKEHRLLRIEKRLETNGLVKGDSISILQRKSCCRKCTETLFDCCCAPNRAAFSSNCECRQIPFSLSFVSKQMRADMIEVLLSQNCFDFHQDPEETIGFLRNLPQGILKFCRRIQLRFEEEEIRSWDQLGYREKLTNLAIFIRDNFNLERLSIVVIVESYDLGCFVDEDEDTRFIYDVCCDITQALSLLHALEDIRFELGWFTDLGPVMERAILGPQHPKCSSERQQTVASDTRPPRWISLPAWHREADFLRGRRV